MKNALMTKVWIRSFEEETEPGTEIYRRDTYQFNPARGREQMDLRELSHSLSRAGPDDRMTKSKGHWAFNKDDDSLTFSIDRGQLPSRSYQVMELDAQKMILQRRQLAK